MVAQIVQCYFSSSVKLDVKLKLKFDFKDQLQIHFDEEICL